jgi:iron complex outermembrane receptor protein
MYKQITRVASLLAVLLLAFVPLARAQQTGRISGTVTAQDGQSIGGAYVVVVGTRHSALTARDGRFVIANVPAGTYTLRITHLSYRDATVADVAVQAGADAAIAPTLTAEPVSLDQLVASASRQAQKITDAPATITKLNADVIANSVGNSFSGALKEVKGIDFIQVGVTAAAINARGFNSSFNNRMLMMEDGRIAVLPENGLPVGTFTTIPKLDLASVEVLVGPGSALYGADASNGVVTLTTKDPRNYPGTSFEVSGGSNKYYDVQGRWAGVRGNLGYKVTGEYQSADDWSNTLFYTAAQYREVGVDGDVDWTNKVARGGGSLFYYMGESQFELTAGLSQSDGVGQTNVGRNQLKGWIYNVAQAKFTAPHFYVNAYRTQSKAGESYALNRYTENRNATANAAKTNEEIRLMSDWPSDGQLYAVEVQNNFRLPQLNTRVVWGGQYRHDVISSDEEWLTDRLTGEKLKIDQKGVYAQIETALLPQLDLIAAARYDDHENYDAQFSPKLGFVFKPAEGTALRATYNRAFKSPTTLQTNFYIPDFTPVVGVFGNTRGFVVKDVTGTTVVATYKPLEPEENTTWEVGYKQVFGDKLLIDVAGYQAKYTNFLSPLTIIANPFAPTNPLNGGFAYWGDDANTRVDSANRLTLTYFNLGEATLRGTDMGVKWLPTRKLDISGTFSWTELTDVSAPAAGTGTPANVFELTALNAPVVKWTAGANVKDVLPRFTSGFTARHVTGYLFRSGINLGWIPTFNTLDFNFSYALPARGLSVNASVQNAFSCVSKYTMGTGAQALVRTASKTECGFDERHSEMVNMPSIGTMLFLGVRYNR